MVHEKVGSKCNCCKKTKYNPKTCYFCKEEIDSENEGMALTVVDTGVDNTPKEVMVHKNCFGDIKTMVVR